MAIKVLGSITKDLQDLRAASPSATARISQRYWGRLTGLVRPRIRWYGRPAVSVDEEDVANDALNSVTMRLQQGKYPEIRDRGSLWRMLACLAVRKAGRLVRRWQGRPSIQPLSTQGDAVDASRSPGSKVAAIEDKRELIAALRAYQTPKSGSPTGENLVRLVELIAEGHEIAEVAARLDVARCTVYRWIDLVKRIAERRGIVRQSGDSAP